MAPDIGVNGAFIPTFVDNKTGIWYGVSGGNVRKSVGNGKDFTWTTVYNFRSIVGYETIVLGNVFALDNGELLVTMPARSEIWLSSNMQTTWSIILTMTPGACPTREFGWSVYHNIVLLSEYGDHNPTNSPRKIYLSENFGQNFTEIFNGTIGPNHHIHTVEYDPWADRIWATRGDRVANSESQQGNLFYSDDLGVTWNYVFRESEVQWTSVIPTKDYVFFGSDCAPEGLWRWRRDPLNPRTLVNPNEIDRILILERTTGIEKTSSIALGASIVGLKANKIGEILYIPFGAVAGSGGRSRLIATYDCENFFELWVGKPGVRGVRSAIGINGDNEIVGTYIDNSLSPSTRYWKADAPVWK